MVAVSIKNLNIFLSLIYKRIPFLFEFFQQGTENTSKKVQH